MNAKRIISTLLLETKEGRRNDSTAKSASGSAPITKYGRHFPLLNSVLSTIIPIRTSVIASINFEARVITPTAAVSSNSASV